MKYRVTLTPLEPFVFGGDITFGNKGDTTNSSYLIKSRLFPQQSALLGMVKKEMMIQAGVLTQKVKGIWVDSADKPKARSLVGEGKFNIFSNELQEMGCIKSIGEVFLIQDGLRYIKKVDIDSYCYDDGFLKNYNAKKDIYDNYICIDNQNTKQCKDIFVEHEQVGNKIGGEENSLFKKTALTLNDGFAFAFYMECDYALINSIVSLGADGSSFKFEVIEDNSNLDYQDSKGYLTLLSDSYINIALKEHCEFAITSEIGFQSLNNKKHASKKNEFTKSKKIYLYEKGSVIINPRPSLIQNLNNATCQQIGYNKYAYTQGK
jgi:CRISPR-associated protein Cmr3